MRIGSLLALAALCVAPLACDKSSENPASTAPSASTKAPITASATASASASSSATAEAPKPKHRFRGNGTMAMFFRAAQAAKLKDEQKSKLEGISKDLHEGQGPSEEMKTLNTDIAAGIKAGKLDAAKLEADQTAVEKVMKARLDKEAEALNALYATLDAEQRKAVVADIREKMKKRAEKMEKWKEKAEGKGPDGKGPEGKGPGGPGGPGMKGPGGPGMKGGPGGFGGPGMWGLAHLTKSLDLDADQQKKVEAILPKPDPKMAEHMDAMKKNMDALLDAFEKDGFDAKKLAPYDGKAAKPDHGAMDMKFLTALLPILKVEQRDKLADRMTKHGGPHGGPHDGKGPAAAASGSAAAPAGSADADDDDDDK